jgi:hypothetical protein
LPPVVYFFDTIQGRKTALEENVFQSTISATSVVARSDRCWRSLPTAGSPHTRDEAP